MAKNTPARKMPVRTETFKLDGDYEGWTFEFRRNPPMGKWIKALKTIENSGENEGNLSVLEGMNGVLELVVHSWNFVDEEGKDLPANRDGIESLPEDLVMMLFEKVMGAITEAPLASNSA